MTTCDERICPNCRGVLKYYDGVFRHIKKGGGVKYKEKIPRYRCAGCRTIHRETPKHILPYKHYEAEIIQGVIDGLITSDTMGYEDYPCEMTMLRWLRTRKKHTPL